RTGAALRLQIECQAGLSFAELSLESLRFYLHGEGQPIATLYELLFNHVMQVAVRPLGKSQATPLVFSPAECIAPVGFERNAGLLPYPNRSFLGYRLLTEFFAFPSKFHFFDLSGWQRVARAGFGNAVEVVFFLDRTETSLEHAVETGTFRLGCTPVVNLFEKTA